MRAVLLSDPTTAQFISREFVASWECVRAVPQVTIDFGNGKVLHRTIAGNTVLYICMPDGRVVDALPGIYTPGAFKVEAAKALAVIRTLQNPGADVEYGTALGAWHKRQVGEAILSEKRRITFSKAMVESPLLKALGLMPGSGIREPAVATANTWEGPVLPNMDLASAFASVTSRLEDISHQSATAVQTRRKILPNGQPGDLSPEELGKIAVELDSTNNIRVVRPAVHMLLAMSVARRFPSDLRDTIYKQILRIAIDDPMLGLADARVPGTL